MNETELKEKCNNAHEFLEQLLLWAHELEDSKDAVAWFSRKDKLYFILTEKQFKNKGFTIKDKRNDVDDKIKRIKNE